MKKTIRLAESDLHRIIANVINEGIFPTYGVYDTDDEGYDITPDKDFDQFEEDFVYKAQRVNKMCDEYAGEGIGVYISNDAHTITIKTKPNISPACLSLLAKIGKYLGSNAQFTNDSVTFFVKRNGKSRKIQYGKNHIPGGEKNRRHAQQKPRYSKKLDQALSSTDNGNYDYREGSGYSSDGMRYF